MMNAKKATFASLVVVLALSCMALAAQNKAPDSSASTSSVAANTSTPISNNTAANNVTTATAGNKSTGLLLPAGSSLHVRLQTTLTSKTNKTGDKFTGYVEQPVVAT